MKNGKSLRLYFAVLVVFLFAGCGALVEKTPVVQEPSPPVIQKPVIKKSTVYFYRPDETIFGWTWKDITILEIHTTGKVIDPDDKSHVSHIGKLRNNSYITKQLNPGEHRFTANWQLNPYVILLKPDEDVCIKAEIGFVNALLRRATLMKMNKSACKADLKNAREISN